MAAPTDELRVAPFEGAPAEWDACVRRSADWTPFHLWGWRAVIAGAHGHECPYLAATDAQGALAGVLPLVSVRSALFGRYLVSMPYVNYGGPLGSPAAVRALVAEAAAMARRAGALLELRCATPQPIDLPVSHRKITVLLELPSGGPDALFKTFPAKLRSQVRRPAKEGVTVRFGADQLAPFFSVFAHHMRDLGTPTQPERYFRGILDQLGEHAWLACAFLGDAPVACGLGFRWGREFEITWASSLVRYNRISANMGLYWAFLERAAAEGCAVFNFGRCTAGGNTHRFKLQWGGRDADLHWYHAAEGANQKTPSPDDGAYSWGPRLWRHLPLAVATALGPRIVRGIP